MSQPTLSQVHVNRPLTNVSIAYIQALSAFIAGRVFPVVPVERQSDIYPVYTKNDWFRDEAKLRPAGGESVGSGYNIDNSNTYYAGVYAIHKDIADQIRANADAGINLDRDATELVTTRLLIRRERIFAQNYFTTGIWGTDRVGGTDFTVWSNYATSDPVTDIETGRTAILQATGYLPNTLVLGWNVFSKLKHHPDIVDRFKYVSSESITETMLGRLFEVERVIVAQAVYASNVEGETAAYAFTHGNHALLCYAAMSPSLLRPSAGYTFAWTGLNPAMRESVALTRFRMEHLRADRVEGEMAFDLKMVASDLGYFWSGAVS